MTPYRRRASASATALRFVLVGLVVATAGLLGVPSPASAANMADFRPGFLISDAVFYNASAMNSAGVQAFLNEKGAACSPGVDGSPCLKNYTENTNTRPADARCPGGYAGAVGESAATIIAKVGAACGVNPQVLLVTLQKEQGLVTAGAGSLTWTRYRSAMGYGCPDTAQCDAKYYGFFNQVYSAASQFRNYALNPTNYGHQAGRTVNVRFHPNAACGSSPVYIENQATAGLYNYTPYQPNAAAIAAGAGTGDTCSSYGNRNFWRFFTDWFGSTGASAPTGNLEAANGGTGTVTVSGWAADPDTSRPISVHVYVDAASVAVLANASRPDVGTHGFGTTIPAAAGMRKVCVYAMNDGPGANTLLGCRDVLVTGSPQGNLETVSARSDGIFVSGWARDPDSEGPVSVHVYVNSTSRALRADLSRPDVGPHGFSGVIPAGAGTYSVCAYAMDTGTDPNVLLGCRNVTVTGPSQLPPTGNLEAITVGQGAVTVSGWARDPDTTGPISVHVYVDSAGTSTTANLGRADVGAHGFSAQVPAAAGNRSVCAYAINDGPGSHTLLGCRTVTVPGVTDRAPVGNLETIARTADGIRVGGWALDPDTASPISVHVYVDAAGVAWTADAARPDVGPHGFNGVVPADGSRHSVCIYAMNANPGPNTVLGCRTV